MNQRALFQCHVRVEKPTKPIKPNQTNQINQTNHTKATKPNQTNQTIWAYKRHETSDQIGATSKYTRNCTVSSRGRVAELSRMCKRSSLQPHVNGTLVLKTKKNQENQDTRHAKSTVSGRWRRSMQESNKLQLSTETQQDELRKQSLSETAYTHLPSNQQSVWSLRSLTEKIITARGVEGTRPPVLNTNRPRAGQGLQSRQAHCS